MKKFFTIFFVVLGVIFFILILLAAYFFITDPLNLKPLFLGSDKAIQTTTDTADTSTQTQSTGDATTPDTTIDLSPSQEKALETFGVDPAAVSSITPEQEACFIKVLGEARVNEIKAGDAPTATEFFRARDCI